MARIQDNCRRCYGLTESSIQGSEQTSDYHCESQCHHMNVGFDKAVASSAKLVLIVQYVLGR